jgi:AcrR family transcriptional regulator
LRGTAASTRDKILAAADELFYGEGVRSTSIDAICKRAGVTKRTLYYHFRLKDSLVAAYLEARDQPTLARLKRAMQGDDIGSSLGTLFRLIGTSGLSPKWKGCAFIRAVHELAGMPGHPANEIARRHKKSLEQWLAQRVQSAGVEGPGKRAKEILVLMDGSIVQMLTHRDAAYADAALGAARACLGMDQRKPIKPASKRRRAG